MYRAMTMQCALLSPCVDAGGGSCTATTALLINLLTYLLRCRWWIMYCHYTALLINLLTYLLRCRWWIMHCHYHMHSTDGMGFLLHEPGNLTHPANKIDAASLAAQQCQHVPLPRKRWHAPAKRWWMEFCTTLRCHRTRAPGPSFASTSIRG